MISRDLDGILVANGSSTHVVFDPDLLLLYGGVVVGPPVDDEGSGFFTCSDVEFYIYCKKELGKRGALSAISRGRSD